MLGTDTYNHMLNCRRTVCDGPKVKQLEPSKLLLKENCLCRIEAGEKYALVVWCVCVGGEDVICFVLGRMLKKVSLLDCTVLVNYSAGVDNQSLQSETSTAIWYKILGIKDLILIILSL